MAYKIDSITANTVDSKVITSETMGLNSLVAQTIESDSLILSGTPITPPSPPSYKVYSALLTQTGSSIPTAVVLENTLGGDVIFTRNSAGNYNIGSNNLFGSVDKCFIQILSSMNYGDNQAMSAYRCIYSNQNTINLETFLFEVGAINYSDWNLTYTPIEIRVYN